MHSSEQAMRKLLFLMLCVVPAVPVTHADIDLSAKQLQIYGELHGSIDYYDRGKSTATVSEPAGVEVTSNSSYIGFKGEINLASDVQGIWKFESEFDLSGEADTIEARHRYVGLSTVAGSLVVGTHSTPLKEIGSRYTLFGDTIGDRTSILGQTSNGDNQFNQRAKSMMLYRVHKDGFSGSLMYSSDSSANSNPDMGDSGVSSRLSGFGMGYRQGNLNIAVAGEKQVAIDSVQGRNASGYRIGLNYQLGDFHLGGLLEVLKDEGYGAAIERDAWAANIAYRITDFVTVAGQYLKAGESPAGGDGARQYSIGIYYNLGKAAQLYLAHAALENGVNASYRLSRSGHGQAYAPTQNGERITAISTGAIYNF